MSACCTQRQYAKIVVLQSVRRKLLPRIKFFTVAEFEWQQGQT